jgi:2-polyprenyl-6-methoxyphenol hydroxylase-like FAD-dependent oxidoreductase
MFRIGIAGCGIAGTAAGAHLARAGHRVTLFERAPVLGPVGAGLLLQVSGQEALAELGLLQAVTSRSEPLSGLRADQVGGRRLIRLPYAAAEPGWQGYGVARGTLFSALLAACRDAGAEIVPSTPIEVRERTPEGSFLIDPDGTRHGPFDFVLAADGARSILRRSSGLRQTCRPYNFGALWGTGPCAGVRGHLYQVVRGTRILIGILPMGNGRASFFWGDFQDRIDGLRARGFAAWRDEVLALCPLAAEIFDELTSFEQTAFVTYVYVSCPRWHDDSMLLLGDAAHAMSPHLGQGANLALADASSFARALAATGDFAAACRRHEAERRAPVEYLARLSFLLTPFFQSGSRVLGWGRDIALPLLTAVPPVRRQMARTLAGKARGWVS